MFEDDSATIYQVVVNHEEQYSIWPADREPPAGWRAVGPQGPKAECLAYISEVWTDLRPLSLRRHMDGKARPRPPDARGVTARWRGRACRGAGDRAAPTTRRRARSRAR
jgi:MbtH protein